jgi:hypothetical protein
MSAANRIQLQLAKFGTRFPDVFQHAAKVMGSRPGYSVTGLILTNKDGEEIAIGKAEAAANDVTKL